MIDEAFAVNDNIRVLKLLLCCVAVVNRIYKLSINFG